MQGEAFQVNLAESCEVVDDAGENELELGYNRFGQAKTDSWVECRETYRPYWNVNVPTKELKMSVS